MPPWTKRELSGVAKRARREIWEKHGGATRLVRRAREDLEAAERATYNARAALDEARTELATFERLEREAREKLSKLKTARTELEMWLAL